MFYRRDRYVFSNCKHFDNINKNKKDSFAFRRFQEENNMFHEKQTQDWGQSNRIACHKHYSFKLNFPLIRYLENPLKKFSYYIFGKFVVN